MPSARGSRILAAWSYRKFLVNLAGIRPLSRIDDTPHTRSLRNPPDRRRLAALDGLLRWRIGTGSGSRVPRAQGRLLLDRRVRQGHAGIMGSGKRSAADEAAPGFHRRSSDLLEAPARLRAAHVTPRNFAGSATDEPVVLAWMPAASVYFQDPDGHQLEFLCMLPDPPQPELGVVTWSRWLHRHDGVATPI